MEEIFSLIVKNFMLAQN